MDNNTLAAVATISIVALVPVMIIAIGIATRIARGPRR